MNNAQRNGSDVLYIYDRVCTKNSKKREILREYGDGIKYAAQKQHENKKDGEWQPFVGKYGNYSADYRRNAGRGGVPNNRKNNTTTNNKQQHNNTKNNNQHNKRPPLYGQSVRFGETRQFPRSAYGNSYSGAAVAKESRFKIIYDNIRFFLDSLEEKGRADEIVAKQSAISAKKRARQWRIIKTALIFVAVTLAVAAVLYNVFFSITDITVSGTDMYSEADILASAEISEGDTLYSFKVSEVENRITFKLPYIKSADVERTVPNSVSLTAEPDTAVYYADIWGDRVILSAGLRVLYNTDIVREEADGEEPAIPEINTDGLICLVLPRVKYSVEGRVIEFEDAKNERYIRDVLTATQNSEYSKIGDIRKIDLRDSDSIKMTAAGKYLLNFGGEEDFSHKLRLVYKTLTSAEFKKSSDAPARIDLSRADEASVLFDLKLKVE